MDLLPTMNETMALMKQGDIVHKHEKSPFDVSLQQKGMYTCGYRLFH